MRLGEKIVCLALTASLTLHVISGQAVTKCLLRRFLKRSLRLINEKLKTPIAQASD